MDNSKPGHRVKRDELLIDEFSKSSVEKVRTRITTYQGKEYLDVRVWYIPRSGSEEEEKPTHKGLTLRLDLLPSLLESLKKAKKILEESERDPG